MVPVIGGRNLFGPLWWAMALPNYMLILAAGALELRVLLRAETARARRQSAFMIAASGITLLANLAYMAGFGGPGKAPVYILSGAAVILVVGILRQGLFGVLPEALPVIASHDPDGLLVVKPNGRLTHANPRARALLAPVELSDGCALPELLAPRLMHRDGSKVAGADPTGDGERWHGLLRLDGALYRYDGREQVRWLRIGVEPVRGRRGRLLAQVLRIHDATEEQRTETQVRRARRLESVAELSRSVAHDFRNLLAVVRGNAELLVDVVRDEPAGQRKVSRILRASEQAGELADQLQLYAGDERPVRTPLDLSRLVLSQVDLMEPDPTGVARSGTIEADMDVASEPLMVEADATQMRQLLMNLFMNAREAMREAGGEICVETGRCRVDPARADNLVLGREQPAGEYVFLEVSDTGPGIDPDAQERIFEPFFSTKGKQRGIGLSTVFGIARSHGALIELESAPGEGSTFRVYLPQVAADPAAS
jgi:signal transduction histidine kinase